MPGPLFALDLVTSSRRFRYFIARVAYATILLLSLWTTWLPSTYIQAQTAANVARNFFETYSFLQLAAVLLLAPAMVAATIASERESRTLDYLLASQLSGVEIVLSKLAARLLHVIFVLSAGVPVLALATLLGGIEPDKLVLVSLLTLSTLLAVAGMSIAVSVWSRRTRDAVIKAYLLLLAFLVVPLVLAALLNLGRPQSALEELWAGAAWCNQWLLHLNPFVLLTEMIASDRGFGGPPGGARDLARIVIGLHLGFAAACTVLAAACVRRVHLASAGAQQRRWRLPRLRLWRPALGQQPMLWKELHAERGFRRLGWLAALAAVLLFLAVLVPAAMFFFEAASQGRPREYSFAASWLGAVVACFVILLAGVRGATVITSEIERDCWTSLLSTPLAARDILGGKVWGNLYAQRWLFALLAILWGVACVVDPAFVMVVPFLAASGLVLCTFASCLGVWFSLAARNTLRALMATAGTLLFIGGGYFFCCLPCLIGIGGQRSEEGLLAVAMAPCIPFLQAFPAVVWQVAVEGHASGDPWGTFALAYLVGLAGYAIGAAQLYHRGVRNFDRLTGRARPRSPHERLLAHG